MIFKFEISYFKMIGNIIGVGLYTVKKDGIKTFFNGDSSSSRADISSPRSLKKDVFLTLEAQKLRNMVSDCIYQAWIVAPVQWLRSQTTSTGVVARL